MAIGDLNGDLRDAYLTPEQRAAKMAGKSSTGPVGRAAGQLPSQPTSLADLAPQQTSFDATNTPAQYRSPPSLAAAGPTGRAATTPNPAPAATAQGSASLASLSPPAVSGAPKAPAVVQIPPRLEDAFPTGIGDGKKAIYGGVGDNGEASFSSVQSGINSLGQTFSAPNTPQPQRMASLSNAWQGPAPVADQTPAAARPAGQRLDLSSAYNPNAAPAPAISAPQQNSLASLGSVRNLGDGVGTFSQANTGDAALAMNRFQRANDIREAGRDKDRLDLANARLTRDQNFTVVRDSSKPPSLSDAFSQQERAVEREGLQSAVTQAQGQLDAGRAGRAADQQQRQALRLEDAFRVASAPNATPEQKAAYAALSDPTGEKAVARQLAQANIARVQADGRKASAEADNLAGGLDTQIKQEQLEKAQRENTAATQDLAAQRQANLVNVKGALQLVNEISSSGNLDGITGTINSRLPTLSNDSQDLINKASRLKSLLTADNLPMMTGVLTDRDITFLAQISEGMGIGEKGINGSTAATKQRLSEIGAYLKDKIATAEKNLPAGQQSPSTPARAAPPQPVRVSTPADVAKLPSGALFIAPDGTTKRKP